MRSWYSSPRADVSRRAHLIRQLVNVLAGIVLLVVLLGASLICARLLFPGLDGTAVGVLAVIGALVALTGVVGALVWQAPNIGDRMPPMALARLAAIVIGVAFAVWIASVALVGILVY